MDRRKALVAVQDTSQRELPTLTAFNDAAGGNVQGSRLLQHGCEVLGVGVMPCVADRGIIGDRRNLGGMQCCYC